MTEEPDGQAEDSASELPELSHVIESFLPSPSPPKKRRKVETTNPLNKPFKSPFRTPLKSTSQPENDAQIPGSSSSTDGGAVQRSPPISAASTFSTAQRSTHPLPYFPSTSPTKPGSQLDKLQKHHTHLLNTLSSLRAHLETTTQALEIEASSEHAELEGLITKWRLTSRDAAEEVFVGMKEKVQGMGGWKKWRSTQAEGARGWNDGQEENKGCAEEDDADREEEGKEEKGERRRMERDVKEQAEKEEDDEEDEGFTMERMLKSLDIPLEMIGSSGRFCQPLRTSNSNYLIPPRSPCSAVKLDSRDTPPPLHFSPVTSEQERSSTAETTPIGTPKPFENTFRRRSVERERDLLSSYYRKTPGFAGSNSSYVDSALLESDFEDSTFPLFQDSSASDRNMDIHSAVAPRRHQTSNLTSALQSTSGNETRPTPAMNISNGKAPHSGFGHRDSLSSGLAALGSHCGSGTHPISMSSATRERPRRESLAGSMVSGMSWGGISVGSWVRDEIIMQGSSPFPQQSPSFHSSSYIPKLEANFMKDFSCCGQIMASLHELLQHYEENHTESLQQRNNLSQPAALPDNKAAIASNTANAVRQSAQQQTQHPVRNTSPSQSKQISADAQTQSNPVTPKVQKAQPVTDNFAASQHHPSLDMDAVQDMEMDDVDYNPQPNPAANGPWGISNQSRMMQRSQFGQPASARVPPLDTNALNMGNPLQQHQGLRNSNPTTPVTASRNGNPYHNNPTVSSVNTPTLTAHPLQQQCYMPTPDSSAPVSPGEMDGDFVELDPMDETTDMCARNQFDAFGNFQFGNGDGMLDLCIDEPAKRLYNAGGDYNSNVPPQQSNASKLGDAQYSENSELARTIRERQKQAGIPDGGSGPNDGIPKPYHCPVIGCEKAYKNLNGLKYHKNHGHNTQTLHANGDGTFSIVDPETSTPYPGTLGMQKHKPYQCDVCGKRYKNLNGLKYHKNHTPGCQDTNSPTNAVETSKTQLKPPPVLNAPNYSQGGSNAANMSGAGMNTHIGLPATGLPGIDEEMIM